MAEYEVRFRRSAEKDLRQLDLFRIRAGNYRIIYSVEDANRLVIIESIRQRREAYR